MTNKHKKTAAAKKTEKAAQKKVESPVAVEQPSFMNFTRAQLAALVIASIGYSKLMELSTAYKEGHENPTSCLNYLGEVNADVCAHPSFSSLILAKYYSGLAMAAYLLSSMFLLWNTEFYFLKFMTLLSFTSVTGTAITAVISQGYLQENVVWHLVIVSAVLFATIAPQSVDVLPFVAHRSFTPQTAQTKTLMGLTLLAAWEFFRVACNSERDLGNSLLETESSLPQGAAALVNFWMLDKLSMMFMYAFAILQFPPTLQRGFLFFTAVIKLAEFAVQRWRMPEPFLDATVLEAATLGSAVASAYGWYV